MATEVKDVKLPVDAVSKLLLQQHAEYIQLYDSKKEDYEYVMTEYLRLSGVYWCLTALSLVNKLELIDKEEVLAFVQSCYDGHGGYGASKRHDAHLLYTLSAIQIAVLYDRMDILHVEEIVAYIKVRQQPDGSFTGDKWGEIDTRFSMCALASLSLLDRLDAVDVPAAVKYVVACMNFDGGFGRVPGSETHAGQIYCCLGALAITDSLHLVDADLLGWWLSERQLPSGGLNGRPEKLPDVCYSWWVLSSLKIIKRLHWVDRDKLLAYILACQDAETGGFADRPGDMVDPFHTLFGIASLSLLQYSSDIRPVDAVFCMPNESLKTLNSRKNASEKDPN